MRLLYYQSGSLATRHDGATGKYEERCNRCFGREACSVSLTMGPLCNASVHLQFADISENGNCSRDFPGNVANVLIASHAKAGRMTRPTIQTTIKNEIVWIEDI
jgi:hypothetical protein